MRWRPLAAVQPPGRFGVLSLEDDRVTSFLEKPAGEGGWVNGGFFVVEPEVLDLIEGDETVWEREPMERLAARPARRVQALRLLAPDGHAARQGRARGSLGVG